MARRDGVVLALLPAAVAAAVLVAVRGTDGEDHDGPGGAAGSGGNATVVRVVDGDTLVADIDGTEERVRLIGIDTPESVARDRPVECFGPESTARMQALVPPGTSVRLVRDVEPRDTYNRLLAYVHRAEDDLHLNLEQVVGGYAEAVSYPPNTALEEDLDTAQRSAVSADAGLWGACGGPDVPVAPPPGG